MEKPKPTKEERKDYAIKRSMDLAAHRKLVREVVLERDKHRCVICFHKLHGLWTPSTEIHHVYGRGKEADDWREQAENLMTVCRVHHPPPIKDDKPKPSMQWIEDLRRKINDIPDTNG